MKMRVLVNQINGFLFLFFLITDNRPSTFHSCNSCQMSVAEAPRPEHLGNPLPPGWTQHRAPTGQPYWYHSFTGMSSWTPPYHSPPVHQGWGGVPQPFNSGVVQKREPEKEKPVERYVRS